MAKDLIIGGASGYDWQKLQYWVTSIQQSGFTGDIVIVATDITKATIDKLISKNVHISAYGKQTEDGGFENPNKHIAPHVERFFYIWEYLANNPDKYRYVTMTDTRDVVFQTNPSVFLEAKLGLAKSFVCSSEGLAYKDEPWGNQNFLDAFGPFFHERFKDNLIYNVGTIAGHYEDLRDFTSILLHMCSNRRIKVCDQAVFNFLVEHEPFKSEVLKTTNDTGWAIQLGTTEHAILAGAGEIGRNVQADPSKLDDYRKAYQDVQPVIKGHKVFTPANVEYCIVHQWDRVPQLAEQILRTYIDGDDENSVTFTVTE